MLVVEDEPDSREAVRDTLVSHGFRVREAADAGAAVLALAAERPDLVILDLTLPGRSGLDLLRDLSGAHGPPVIILTGRSGEADRVTGLELGADDYVVKPFYTRELVARVRAVLRRGHDEEDSERLDFETLVIDLRAREVLLDGDPAPLTTREFELLAFLARSPRQVFSSEQLLRNVWEADPDWQDLSTVSEHIYRIRRKLGSRPDDRAWITTVRNAGYRFEP